MSITEIIAKAKELDRNHDCDGVLALLEPYIKENSDNKMAVALYQKNYALKTLFDWNVNLPDLYENNAADRYLGIAEDSVLPMSGIIFTKEIADVYSSEKTEDEKANHIYGYLSIGINSLGNRAEDYSFLEKVLDKYSEVIYYYGYGKLFYKYLSVIVDWRSKVSENILHYLVKKAQAATVTVSDKAIYDEYIKSAGNAFSFEDKPALSGGRLVIINIKTGEAKDFWKGYFALAKKIRREEYDDYKQATADESSEKYEAYKIGEYIHDAYIKALTSKVVSTEEIAKMQIATGCHMVSTSESEYKARIDDAQRSFDTVKVNPIEQGKAFIGKLFGKK